MMKRNTETPFVFGQMPQEEMEQLRFLRTNFLHSAEECGVKSVLVTTDQCGREACIAVVKLGCALTALGKRVLLVDLNRADASLASLVQAEPGKTYNDYLSGRAKAEELAAETKIPGLFVICARPEKQERLEDDLLTGKLVEAEREAFDFVFLIAAPESESADVFSFDEISDGVMILVRKKSTKHKFLKLVLEYYARRESRVVGIVMI